MHAIRVAVSGAGLAGLALAHHLHRNGVEVTVFERDGDWAYRNPGYRLHINATGARSLHTVLDTASWQRFLDTAAVPRQRMLFLDHRLGPGPERDTAASRGADPAPSGVPEHLIADRALLRGVLARGVTGSIRFGQRVLGYTEDPHGRVRVTTDHGRHGPFDLLVAADGVRSTVRRQRLPGLRVVDLGARHVVARIPLDGQTLAAIPPELFSAFTYVRGPHHQGVSFAPFQPAHLTTVDAYAMSAFSWPADSAADAAGTAETADDLADRTLFTTDSARLRDAVLDRVRTWHPAVTELVRHWDLDTVQALTLRSSVPIPPWPSSRVTLMGDAVHAMSPALGIGANTALRDAATLGPELLATGTVPSAVRNYEGAMTGYGFTAVRDSAEAGRHTIGHHPLPGDAA